MSSQPSVMQCEGWWEQDGYGRQPMESLELRFARNRLRGQGVDMIGLFTMDGVIDIDGGVRIRKQYLGQHHVDYIGSYDGEGLLTGVWRIDPWSGDWLIRIRRAVSESPQEIQEFAPRSD